MADTAVRFEPRRAARVAGILYLLIIAGGLFAEVFVRQQLIVPGDAAATAANVLNHELLYRLGFAANLFYLACAVPVVVIFYELFRRVDGRIALLALLFNAIAIAIEAGILLNHLAPLRILGAAGFDAFDQPQLEEFAYTFPRLFSSGFGISLTFFGFFCLTIGYLIYRSGFLPRIFGGLMAVAGVCYLVNSYSLFIAPSFATLLFPYILLASFVAELALALWLVFAGIDVRCWEAAGRE